MQSKYINAKSISIFGEFVFLLHAKGICKTVNTFIKQKGLLFCVWFVKVSFQQSERDETPTLFSPLVTVTIPRLPLFKVTTQRSWKKVLVFVLLKYSYGV